MAYTAVYVFGDSLVDSGNALKLAEWYDGLPFTDLPDGAPTVEDGYFKGRFSDGYNFADLVSNKAIGLVTKPVFPYEFEDPWLGIKIAPFASDPKGINLNFAYGGSHIIQGDEVVPDFDEQTDAFRHAVDFDADPNALYLITLGGNDVRDLAPTGSNPVSQAEAYETLDEAAAKLLHELVQLMDIGAQNFVITGLADVGLIPRYDRDGNDILDATESLRSAAATDYSIYLDTLIRTEVVPALEALGANVTYVPLMDYVDEFGNAVTGALSANLPTIAALHGLTTEELSQNLLQYQDLLFFDEVHPNAQANALLGAYMHALITGTPWIETLPLTGADVDYRMTGTIAVKGEVDGLVVSLVAGTAYTLEMLGVSSLGTSGSLADPFLRLLGPSGNVIGTSSDEGVGFDARLTFIAPTTGSYTVEFLSTGAPTGFYSFQAAVVSGAAMNGGNSYNITNASTVVLEGAGGIGQDVIKASVSYALSEGSEIEILRTANDRGKGAINLTGNEFGQTIIGNAGINVIEGKGGSDVLTGGGDKDIFVLSNAAVTNPGAANIDRITDYSNGEVVDIRQILNVASGTNVITGGYLRVTTSGLIQVDLDGGANNWVTLSSVNGGGAVTVRYSSGGVATNVSVQRVAETQQMALSATNSNAMFIGAAAAGLIAVPAAAENRAIEDGGSIAATSFAVHGTAGSANIAEAIDYTLLGDASGAVVGTTAASATGISEARVSGQPEGSSISADEPVPNIFMALEQGTEPLLQYDAADHGALVAKAVAMPPAEILRSALHDAAFPSESVEATAKQTGEVARILADELSDGTGNAPAIDSLMDAFPPRPLELALAWQDSDAAFEPAIGHLQHLLMMEVLVAHQAAHAIV
jgi:phospholipase/lecithinase/hemolysin